MSAKEIAYEIINRLSEKQLQGFIALFSDMYPVGDDDVRRLVQLQWKPSHAHESHNAVLPRLAKRLSLAPRYRQYRYSCE